MKKITRRNAIGIVATAAGSDPTVNGYLFNINAGNPVINVNLNALTQTAVGVGNLGSVANEEDQQPILGTR